MEKRCSKGSLTVEAACFLVIFVMAFMLVVSFGRLARAQVVMQHAINDTALQISQYGYVLTKAGVTGQLVQTGNRAKQVRSDSAQIVGAVSELSNAIGGISDGGISESDIGQLRSAASSMQDAGNIVSGYFKDPQSLLTGILALGQAGVEEYVGSAVISHIAGDQVEAYLGTLTDDPNAYLKELGIVGGLDGLDFSDSRFAAGGTQDVQITVRFTVKNQMFPMLDFGERELCINATTRIW